MSIRATTAHLAAVSLLAMVGILAHCSGGGDGISLGEVVWCPIYMYVAKFCHFHLIHLIDNDE